MAGEEYQSDRWGLLEMVTVCSDPSNIFSVLDKLWFRYITYIMSTESAVTGNAQKPIKEAAEVPSGPVDKRIYIGGLHPSTTEDQIVERFSKFGQVSNVAIAKNTDSECAESMRQSGYL